MSDEDVYRRDEYFIRGEEPREGEEYEGETPGEPSLMDEEETEEEEEEEEMPTSPATISAAEKSEEEVRDAAEPDHVLAEIPVEVRINLSFTIILPVELLCLATFLIF